ncbi:MAG: rRNA maturation RNase YbeY [Patescibacteria group bacterium]
MIIPTLIKSVSAPAVNEKNIFEVVSLVNKNNPEKGQREINIIIVSDREIRKINRIYRHKDKITDVLSFIYTKEVGEIYIAYNRACRQAKEKKISVRKEVNILLIHGLFHILGYDHVKNSDAEKMIIKEQQILCRLV